MDGNAQPQMSDLSAAILRAVVYADLFDFPIARTELEQQLPFVTATSDDIERCLRDDVSLAERVTRHGDLFFMRGRDELIEHRQRQEQRTDDLIEQHVSVLKVLSHLPWVRMIAFSGGTSRKNSVGHDDIDLFIVTERHRAWSVYALFVIVARLMRCREVLCANYLVDVDHLAVPDRGDLFTGHEMMSLVPLVGAKVLETLVAKNSWVDELLPNARPRGQADLWRRSRWEGRVRRAAEIGLWPVGGVLERMARGAFGARIRHKARAGQGDVLLRPGILKLHTTDNRARVVDRFRARLRSVGAWNERLDSRLTKRTRP